MNPLQTLILSQDPFCNSLLEMILKEARFRTRLITMYEQLGIYSANLPTVAWFIDLDGLDNSIYDIFQFAQKTAPDAKLIFLSAQFTKDIAQACLKTGAISLLVKPLALTRLMQTVNHLLQEPVLLDTDTPIPNSEKDLEKEQKGSLINDDENENLRWIELNCPICKTIFESKKFKLWVFPVTETDTDFYPKCDDNVHPELYTIMVCPNCLYANYVGKFEAATYSAPFKTAFLQPEQFEQRRALAIKLDFRRNRTLLHGVKSFELAATAAITLKATDRRKQAGEFFLKASWLCRRMGHPKNEQTFQEKALECFLRIYEPHRTQPISIDYRSLPFSKPAAEAEPLNERATVVTGFLIAELWRRLGYNSLARAYFDDVLRSPLTHRFTSLSRHINAVYREFQTAHPRPSEVQL
jgi:CheY-like chemotaxis protein